MILAALLFIARVAETTTVSQVTGDYVEDGRLHILQDKESVLRDHLDYGPFLFGARQDRIGDGENAPAAAIVIIPCEHDGGRTPPGLSHWRNSETTARYQKTHADLMRAPRAAGQDDS